MGKNKVVGNLGEEQACAYLVSKKYKILARNWAKKFGELDIVAKKKNTIIFVEVKARGSLQFGSPCEAVDTRKQQKIRLTAQAFLQEFRLFDNPSRFDVIEVFQGEINHIENAF